MNDKPRKPRLTSRVMKSLSMASGYLAADAQGMNADEVKIYVELMQAVRYIDELANWYHAKGKKVTK